MRINLSKIMAKNDMNVRIVSVLFILLPLFSFSQGAQDYYNAAMIKFVSKRYSESIQDFSKAIKEKPGFIDAYFNRGIAYEKVNMLDKAIKDYSKVIKLDPGMNEAYINRALLYKKGKRYNLAIEDFNTAIELRPNFAFAYLYRGDTYYEMDSLEAAANDYKLLLDLLPSYLRAHERLALIYYQQGNYEDALTYASKLCSLNSSKASNFVLRAKILIALKRLEPACKDIKHAIEMGSEEAKELSSKNCK
jgi:tetratricopeptide (TPR) repeat protein